MTNNMLATLGSGASTVLSYGWLYSEPGWEPAIMYFSFGGLFAYRLVLSISAFLQNRSMQKILPPLRKCSCSSMPVKESDLDELYHSFTSIFGQDIAGLAILREILRKCPQSIWRVDAVNESSEDSKRVFVGFFELFPLSKNAKSAQR